MFTTKLEYSIEKTKDGYNILKISDNGKSICIGSKYNMKREIEKFLNSFKTPKDKRDVFVIYGFGTGDHIEALRKRYSNKIIVFEPNRNLMSYVSSFEWIKKDSDMKILCCEEKEAILTIGEQINEFNYKNSEYLSFSNYNHVYKCESKTFFKKLNDYIIGLALDTNTKLKFSKRWFENLIEIIPHIVNGVPADIYDGKYFNKPAIIVSAGPSLMKNIDLLKEVDDNMLIFTGGRTLKALFDKNIKFHLLTIADTTDLNYELVKDYIDEVHVPLLFSEGANMNIVEHHKGFKLFYSYNDFIYKIVGRRMSHISTAGSVSHAMTSYAANLGCNPIIFIGQDFAFTGEKYYSKLTDCDHNSKDLLRNQDNIFVEDVFGNEVRTNYALNNQRIGMEEIISLYKDINFINATEGGAKINGTVEMRLKDVIEKYKGEKITRFKEADYNINLRNNAIRELKRAKEFGNKLCNTKITQIDEEIRNFIKQLENNDLFYYLLYPLIYEFFRTDKHKDNLNDCINKFKLDVTNELKYGIELINNELMILQ